MEAYIVKIYRRSADDPQYLVGQIEHVGKGYKRPFHNTHELVDLLSLPSEPDNQASDSAIHDQD